VSFDIATLSRAGGRAANEDYADFLQMEGSTCWVIADGLGGHQGGATASKTVVEAALESFRERPDVSVQAVEAHVAHAQAALIEAQRREPRLSQMRSTIVVLISGDRGAVWAHVGDSRLYHLRGGQVIARTRDHSVGQALVDGGQIDIASQGSHEDRSRLLRCLGKDEESAATVSGPHALARGDVFLLCTDGFWEALDDLALGVDLAAADDASAWLDRLEARLRRRIGVPHDNYSATAVRVLSAAAPAPPAHDPRAPVRESLAPVDADVRPRVSVDDERQDERGNEVSGSIAAALRSRRRAISLPAAAAIGLIAIVLIAAGVRHRAALAAWLRALVTPAAATSKPDTAKDAPAAEESAKKDLPKGDSPKEVSPKTDSPKGDSSKEASQRKDAGIGKPAPRPREGAPLNEGRPRKPPEDPR
jgi:PPM family protein phosphatase